MPIKKGENPNPFGSLPIGQDLKDARKISRIEFERLANKYLFMSFGQLESIMQKKDANIPVIEFAIMSIMYHAIKDGDTKRLDFMLDRTIGQAVRKIHVVTEVDDNQKKIPVNLTDQQRIDMAERYMNMIKKQTEGKTIDAQASVVSRNAEQEISEGHEE